MKTLHTSRLVYVLLVPIVLLGGYESGSILLYGIEGHSPILLSLLLGSAVGVAFAVLVFHFKTVSRLQKLEFDVKRITQGSDLSLRVRENGEDELAALAVNINGMLASLENTQEYLVVARDSAEAADRAKSALIEQLRRRDLELVKARNTAEQASSSKSDFLANTSHEIRTPINNIIGFAEVLSECMSDEKEQRYVHLIKTSADSLLALINDILDLSKIEAQKMKFVPMANDLGAIVRSAMEPFRAQAERKGISFSAEIDESLPRQVLVDPGRFGQVVVNLINNALKFTVAGGFVRARLDLLEIKNHLAQIRFSVTDNGIGISPSAQKRIFEAFEQADTSTSRQFGGTGLGLAISQQIVNAMGGIVTVESAVGKGSTFSFSVELPVIELNAQAGKAASGASHPVVGKNLNQQVIAAPRVLVVEDNAMSREISVHRLKKFGFEVAIAESGEQAVQLAKSQSFDLILMDCQMPNMDGFQATALIRQEELGGTAHCPIVALTAHAMEGYKEVCLRAGMDDFLTKPIKEVDLQKFLTRFQVEKQKAAEEK